MKFAHLLLVVFLVESVKSVPAEESPVPMKLLQFMDGANKDFRQSNFSNADLSHANFRGADLRQVSFRNSDLTMAKFSGAILTGADVAGAKFDRINLDDADLKGIVGWSEIVLGLGMSANRADFSNSDLRKGRLLGGYSGGYFEGADFTNTDLSNAVLAGRFHGAKFDGAIVTGALMIGASGLDKIRQDLSKRGAIATPSDFAAAIASGTEFSNVFLQGCQLQNSNLMGGNLSEADFHSANLVNSRFDQADLHGAEFYWVKSTGASFQNADLRGAMLNSGDFSSSSFRKASMQNASLRGARLPKVDFTQANLTGADFSHADLTDADFSDAVINGIVVDATILDGVKGLDSKLLRTLNATSARWWYDVQQGFDNFLKRSCFPIHFLLTLAAILFATIVIPRGNAATTFKFLVMINVLSAVPQLIALGFAVRGGSPTAQLSDPGLWSAWFDLWPLLFFGVLALLAVSLVMCIVHVVLHVVRKRGDSWKLMLACAVLTPINCFAALCSIVLTAPDA